MNVYINAGEEVDLPPVQELTSSQRRVLGVLVEKAFTTPDAYPLTLKSLTTAANQKSNRNPVTNYSEDEMYEVIDELRQLGLAATVNTDGGRAERYRHYMRKRFTFSEPQLAIMTELMLRGRQTLGELRQRASRMVAIESLDALRNELRGLFEQGYMQSTGPIERRGVEVDHALYRDKEQKSLGTTTTSPEPATSPASTPQVVAKANVTPQESTSRLEAEIAKLQTSNQELRDDLENIRNEMQTLDRRFDDLRHDLGG